MEERVSLTSSSNAFTKNINPIEEMHLFGDLYGIFYMVVVETSFMHNRNASQLFSVNETFTSWPLAMDVSLSVGVVTAIT